MLICKHCFLDAEMQSEVEANASSEGVCDVCHKQGKVIDSSEFADFLRLYCLCSNVLTQVSLLRKWCRTNGICLQIIMWLRFCWVRFCSHRR